MVERLLEMSPDGANATLHECFRSLMEACIHLKEVQDEASDGVENAEEEEEEASDEDTDDEEDDDIDDEVQMLVLFLFFFFGL